MIQPTPMNMAGKAVSISATSSATVLPMTEEQTAAALEREKNPPPLGFGPRPRKPSAPPKNPSNRRRKSP